MSRGRYRDLPDGRRACGRCGEPKPLVAFHVDRDAPRGRRGTCAACRKARAVAPTPPGMRRCSVCGKAKPLEAFHPKPGGARRRQCKVCKNIRLREHQRSDEGKAARREYEARPAVKARRAAYAAAWARRNAARLAVRNATAWTRLVRARAHTRRQLGRADDPARAAALGRLLRLQDEAVEMMRRGRERAAEGEMRPCRGRPGGDGPRAEATPR